MRLGSGRVDSKRSPRITSAPRKWWSSRYFVGRLALWQAVTPMIPEGDGRSVFLDAGCGVRPLNEFLKARGHHVVGVDLASEVPADARANIQRLPFRDETFSGSLCLSVLQYVSDPAEACKEIHRVLTPGSKATFALPCFVPIDPIDRWRWTEHAARAMLEEAGFTEIMVSPAGSTATTLFHLLALSVRKAIPVAGRAFGTVFDLIALAGLKITNFSVPGAYAIRGTKPLNTARS